jgi:uncharacterized protein
VKGGRRIAVRTARAFVPALALLLAVAAGAQVPVPPAGGRVTDLTATLTGEQASALERALRSFEARKGSQVAVLLVPSTAPETIEQYALRVAEQWKPGRKNVDDGAILVVAKDDRTLRIEVGYGLEGALTDAACKRIISEVIVPRFREGDFHGGIAAGIDRILRVIDGEPLPKPAERKTGAFRVLGQLAFFLPFLLLIVGGALQIVLGRLFGALATGGIVSFVAWMLMGTIFIAAAAGILVFLFVLLVGAMGERGYGGGHLGGGFGGGGFGGGGFGGGGFGGGGFGGGGFGGGGASGRW